MDDLHTVLLVEDEESYVDALSIGLKRERFRVIVARDGEQAMSLFASTAPDIVLLDVMLPRKSGLDICREIRAISSVPIIMVTAKTAEIDAVVGLEVGADDYIAKPYRLRELVARMRAVMRRVPAAAESDDDAEAIVVAEIRLDRASHEVFIREERVALPLKEFELLEYFMENAGRVLTRDQLINRVWGLHYVGDTKTLDVHVKRLRARIETSPHNPRRLITIRGLGYKLEAR